MVWNEKEIEISEQGRSRRLNGSIVYDAPVLLITMYFNQMPKGDAKGSVTHKNLPLHLLTTKGGF